jgi:prepilin-type N-terminal cleavage/methylation domain-containing protein
MNNAKQKMNKGFSLVEIIVVTSIITLSFMGVMSLVRRTISLRSINEDSLVASQLAAEGIELVKNMRNDNWLQQDKKQVPFEFGLTNNQLVDGCDWGAESKENCDYFIIDYTSRPSWDYSNDDGIPKQTGSFNIHFYYTNQSVKLLDNDALQSDATRLYLLTDSYGRTFYGQLYDGQLPDNIATSEPTIYHRILRSVLYEDAGGVKKLKVQARVYWQNRGKDNYYDLTTELYDYEWYY